jgi:hypothetical protein
MSAPVKVKTRSKEPPRIFTYEEIRAIRRAVVTDVMAKRVIDAYRVYEAGLWSGWDSYEGAIAAARAGYTSRLVDCLRGRRPLTDDNLDLLKAYIATRVRRRRWPDWLADVSRSKLPTDADYDRLANFVEFELRGRRQGRPFHRANHRAVRMADVVLSLVPEELREKLRGKVVDYVCQIERWAKPEQVQNLLARPEARRHKQ